MTRVIEGLLTLPEPTRPSSWSTNPTSNDPARQDYERSAQPVSIIIISTAIQATPEAPAHSFVYEEARWLAKLGVRVHVLSPRILRRTVRDGITFHPVRPSLNRAFAASLGSWIRAHPMQAASCHLTQATMILAIAIGAAKVIAREHVDIIHAHFAYPEGFAGLLAKRLTGLPLVVTVHGYDILLDDATGYGIRQNRAAAELVHQVLEHSDSIITASNYVLKETAKVVSQDQRLSLIPNGVDLDRFRTFSASGRNAVNPRTIFALRAHEPKYGLEYLIRAMPQVLASYPNAHCVIGGDGSLRRSLELLARRLQIGDRVTFTGTIPGHLVPQYYQDSYVVVVPSLTEAFGLAVTEAMACGKPVIAAAVGGILDQVIDGVNGFLVPPRDSKSIADKLVKLLGDEALARRMGEAGRRIAEEQFSLEKRAESIRKVYLRLLGLPREDHPASRGLSSGLT